MHLIKSIEITNFRSIQHEVIKCSDYNLFCGLNDVGKSNVLKALNLFFNGETDFMTPLDFSTDYNKISLAKATRSDKQKQQIKIKVTFNVPQSYRSLSGKKDFYIERIFDRYGKPETKYSEDEKVKKASIARLNNKIRFVYIPALKGEAVIQYLLGLIGEFELVNAQAIDNMNTQINNSTKDLSGLLSLSNIGTGAYFGLPTLLRDFWQRLSVNTAYEQFSVLDKSIEGTAKEKGRKLNQSNYQIPLTLRGEGIKSKYIPPLLQWLQQNNKSDYYIWGIDEPENSLEFRASEHLSGLFCDEYALTTQVFGTTHSMAFINPPIDAIIKPTVFRCLKTETGATVIRPLEDLLKEQNKQELLDDLGALDVQKHIIQEFREKMKIVEEAKKSSDATVKLLEDKVVALTKPLVITEGKTDWKHMKAALERLKEQSLDYATLDFDFYEYQDTPKMGCTELDKMCKALAKVENNPKKIICIFDRDEANILREHGESGFKSWGNNVYSFCIPCPDNRTTFANVSIEFYYSDREIKTVDQTTNTRLFFTNEIDELVTKDQTNTKDCTISYIVRSQAKTEKENDKKIWDGKIEDVKDENGLQIAHSKNCFAENILNKKAGFSSFDVSNFALIFNVIKNILDTTESPTDSICETTYAWT